MHKANMPAYCSRCVQAKLWIKSAVRDSKQGPTESCLAASYPAASPNSSTIRIRLTCVCHQLACIMVVLGMKPSDKHAVSFRCACQYYCGLELPAASLDCPGRYIAGDDVLALCAEVDFPPCLMMRRMLELLMRLSKQVRPAAERCGRLENLMKVAKVDQSPVCVSNPAKKTASSQLRRHLHT